MLKKVLGLLLAILMLTQPLYAIAQAEGENQDPVEITLEGLQESPDLILDTDGEGGGEDPDLLNSEDPEEPAPTPDPNDFFTVVFYDGFNDPATLLSTQTVLKDNPAAAPAAPAHDGVQFDGWYTAQTGGEKVSDFAITGNTSFYAQYTSLASYTVTIYYKDADGKLLAPTFAATVLPGESVSENSPSVTGYTLRNSSDSTVTFDNVGADDEYTVVYELTAEVNYTICYYLEEIDGSYPADAVKTVTGTAHTGTVVVAPREAFSGFSGPASMPSFTVNAEGDEFIVYYTRNSYSLTFDTTGGDPMAQVSIKYDDVISAPSATPTRAGYNFAGWTVNQDGTGSYGGKSKMGEGGFTLYAKWTPKTDTKYTVVYWMEKPSSPLNPTAGNPQTYDYAGSWIGQGTTDQSPVLPTGIPGGVNLGVGSSYCTSAGNDLAGKKIAGDGSTIVNVYYNRKAYTVSFSFPGATITTVGGNAHNNSYSITAKFGADIEQLWPESVSDKRIGHWVIIIIIPIWIEEDGIFSHWISSYSSTDYETIQYVMDEDLAGPGNGSGTTLTAEWVAYPQTVKVNYIFQNIDGSYPSSPSISQDIATVVGTTLFPKSFTGFTPTSEDGVKVKNNTAQINFKYSRNSYTLRYWSNGVKWGNDIPLKYQQSLVQPSDPAAPAGYRFAGWYTASAGGTLVDFGTAKMPASNLMLYAHFEASAYTVAFISNGGSAVDSQDVAYNGKAAKPADPVYTGWEFEGWYLNNARYNFAAPVTGNITLEARWTAKNDISYTVNYWNDDAKVLLGTKTVENRTTGTKVTEIAPFFAGFRVLESSLSIEVLSGNSADNVIDFRYTAAGQFKYIVRATFDGETPAGYVEPTVPTLTPNRVITVNFTPYAGYLPTVYQQTVTFTDTELVTVTFEYKKTLTTSYTVKHYLQNVTGLYYTAEPGEVVSGVYAGSMTAPVQPNTYTGFTYSHQEAPKPVADGGGTVIKVYYKRDTCTVNFLNKDGSPFDTQEIRYLGSAVVPETAPTALGYAFAGWNLIEMSLDNITEGFDVESLWEMENYTITYNLAGGSKLSGGNYPDSYTVETETFGIGNATRANHTFLGWKIGENTAAKDVQIMQGSTGNLVLTAQWQLIYIPASVTPTPLLVTPAPTVAPRAVVTPAATETPAPTASPSPALTVIPEESTPLNPEPDAGLTDIPDEAVPLEAQPEGTDAMTLVNLIAMVLTMIGAALLMFRKSKKDEENGFKRIGTKVIALVAAVGGIVLFFLTQPLTGMDIWDNFSVWQLLILAVYAAMAIIAYVKKKAQDKAQNADA
ncbi:MAG TPA: InlB B-repeat-containing protein [Clostridia bacterium]|nr:InlB B-repeat-containing protein [Clostridia bacterium]